MRAVLLALMLGLVATPAWADRFLLRYDGAGLGFIPLGNVVVDADVGDDYYNVTTRLNSGGLLNLFERTDIQASASGTIDAAGVHWRDYSIDHHYSRKHRTIVMHVGDDGAVTSQINPNYRLWGEPPTSDEQRRSARDPLSTMIAMSIDVGASHRCTGSYPTFDGRFFYRLELSRGRIMRFGGGGYYGDVLKCDLAYVAVAGFEAHDAGRRRIPHGEAWFALAPNARFAPPVHISTPFSAGAAVIRLTHWHRAEISVEVEDEPQ